MVPVVGVLTMTFPEFIFSAPRRNGETFGAYNKPEKVVDVLVYQGRDMDGQRYNHVGQFVFSNYWWDFVPRLPQSHFNRTHNINGIDLRDIKAEFIRAWQDYGN